MENIHSDFGKWYRAAKIEPTSELLTKRWAGVDHFEAGKQQQVELAKLFFQLSPVSEKVVADFRASFFAHDPAFPEGNDIEMRALAGAELVDCWVTYNNLWGSLATLLIICGSCRNLRSSTVAPIVELAVGKLGQLCVARFGVEPKAGETNWSETILQQLKEPLEKSAVPQLAAPLNAIVAEIDRLRGLNSHLQRRLLIQGEETNMLWWVFGGFFLNSEKKYSDLKAEVSALAIGKDLARQVAELPGPLAAQAFIDFGLNRAGHKLDQKVKIKDAVMAVDEEMRKKWTKSFDVEPSLAELCPVSTAIRLSVDSGKPVEWAASFVAGTGLKKDASLTVADLAYQLYLELVLNKVWKQLP